MAADATAETTIHTLFRALFRITATAFVMLASDWLSP